MMEMDRNEVQYTVKYNADIPTQQRKAYGWTPATWTLPTSSVCNEVSLTRQEVGPFKGEHFELYGVEQELCKSITPSLIMFQYTADHHGRGIQSTWDDSGTTNYSKITTIILQSPQFKLWKQATVNQSNIPVKINYGFNRKWPNCKGGTD